MNEIIIAENKLYLSKRKLYFKNLDLEYFKKDQDKLDAKAKRIKEEEEDISRQIAEAQAFLDDNTEDEELDKEIAELVKVHESLPSHPEDESLPAAYANGGFKNPNDFPTIIPKKGEKFKIVKSIYHRLRLKRNSFDPKPSKSKKTAPKVPPMKTKDDKKNQKLRDAFKAYKAKTADTVQQKIETWQNIMAHASPKRRSPQIPSLNSIVMTMSQQRHEDSICEPEDPAGSPPAVVVVPVHDSSSNKLLQNVKAFFKIGNKSTKAEKASKKLLKMQNEAMNVAPPIVQEEEEDEQNIDPEVPVMQMMEEDVIMDDDIVVENEIVVSTSLEHAASSTSIAAEQQQIVDALKEVNFQHDANLEQVARIPLVSLSFVWLLKCLLIFLAVPHFQRQQPRWFCHLGRRTL